MKTLVTPSAIDVFGKARLEDIRHRPAERVSNRTQAREDRPHPIVALLVFVRLRTART